MSKITYSQSTDLDRETFSATYVNLPSHPILDNQLRTYSSENNDLTIYGFSRIKSNASISVNYRFNGTITSDVKINTQKHEKKDKDGKVTSVSYTYSASATYRSKATLRTVNNLISKSWNNTFNESKNWNSSSFSTYKKAQNYYNNNRHELKSKYRTDHRNSLRTKIKNHINYQYGYTVFSTSRAYFWILGSQKHPEFIKHKEAYEELKALLATMKFDESTDEISKKAMPIIDYFNDVTKRYEGKKRKARKIRFASYYNIAKLYYYLDDVEKCKEYANKIIENDYDKSEGKYFLRIAKSLEKELTTNQVTSRHMGIITEDLGDVGNEVFIDQGAIGSSPKMSKELVYLITKDQDTIKGMAMNFDESNIGFGIELHSNNQVKFYKSEECKTLAIPNIGTFKSVNFKDAATNNTSRKITKELFSSPKIGLYVFQNKELVLKLSESEVGSSLNSSDFAFGFNTALDKFTKDCSDVAIRVKSGEFKNNEESMIKFCQALSACK